MGGIQTGALPGAQSCSPVQLWPQPKQSLLEVLQFIIINYFIVEQAPGDAKVLQSRGEQTPGSINPALMAGMHTGHVSENNN